MTAPAPFDRGDRVTHPEHGEGVVRECHAHVVWVHFDKHAATRGYGTTGAQLCIPPAELALVAPSTLPLWERLWAF